ncbi:uncharacterized protein F5891DRAFT_131185 [Suillus fuscotomentosus]|uniref:Uncharacterized protein n=1 Tax=Suillus fuscotomentosus TaxID=1912939 RepID=A0AAD4EAU4_9AGAM|nr:uncharacterized protein F5891DRAFT_131185 [Suillus fuscotomentosus]KAG1902844.1 hypothetical protein F5891DRAFT_131185 [Suillus fuscotomentosus]
MHFSFLVVVTALTACMSVTACSPQFTTCQHDTDCCPKYLCASTSVSMSSWLCIQDFLLLTPCTSISLPVRKCAIIRLPMCWWPVHEHI